MATAKPQAKRWILLAMFTAAAFSSAQDVVGGRERPRMRIVLGATLAAFMLALMAELQPDLALALALVTALSAVLSSGQVFTTLTGVFG